MINNASFHYLILGSFVVLLLASCQKDQLTVTQLDPGSASDCGDKFYEVDVAYYYNTIPPPPPVAYIPICACDTLELTFVNVPFGLTFFEWQVYDPFTWIFAGGSPTLILENPNTQTYIELLFDDGINGIFPIFIFLEEDSDC